jgi:hypothetical protein
MIWTNLNLHYVRILSCKFEIFWACGSWEDFWMTLPYFCIFVIISPLNRTCLFIWTILNSLQLRMICTKFHWNWPASSGEEHFKKQSVYFYSFAIISPWKRGLPFTWTIWNLLYLRMICANFGYNWSSSSGKEVENVKFYRRTTCDQERSLSFQLRWTTNKI